MHNYTKIEEVIADGDIPITVYQNEVTGLRVVSVYVQCPIVKGDLVFATEAFDDDGLPHTLEHLVFLGAEDYPYKGVLDMVASRCLASGTNAYTETDHTNYSLITAGGEGFLQLLPVYLEHLLFPLLKDEYYTTEVHHINQDGEDAGIVYCEMQARENTGEERCFTELVRDLYPGRCGYKSVTGGILANLRESTSNTKCRDYHKQFYHTKNLCVVVTGPVKPEEIFKAIKSIEDKVISRGIATLEFTRPWQTPVEPMPVSKSRKIKYSCDTEDDGIVYIGFRGPNAVKNFKELTAISVLLDYLNDTSVSPIQQEFVEREDPYCSSVSQEMVENTISFFCFQFESVDKKYMDEILTKFLELMKAIATGQKAFDMIRLKTIISRKIVRILSIGETSPHALAIGAVIGNFLYGNNNLQDRCQEIPVLREFTHLDSSYWLNLIEKYMVGPNSRYSCIIGEPSLAHMKQSSEEEENRIATQKKKLEHDLPRLAKELEEAVKNNEKPPPDSLIKSFPVPSPDTIKLFHLDREVLPTGAAPFRIQLDSIKTNFITINLMSDTSHVLEKHDRLYLPLLREMFFECPIKRGEEVIPYEKVVAELFSETIIYGDSIGLSSSSSYSPGVFSMLFQVVMQVEIERYEKAVNWFHELLYKSILSADRIKTVATRMVSDISQFKRSGGKILSSTSSAMIHNSDSNHWATNFMRQQKFLKGLLKNLKADPLTVERELTRIKNTIVQPQNILVHIALDKKKVKETSILDPWRRVVPEEYNKCTGSFDICGIKRCNTLVNFIEDKKAVIVGVGSVESNYLQQMVKSIDSYTHPDLPALYVLIQYLTQLEGPLWRQVRGLGLSYHYSIDISPSDGCLYFLLYKSSQLIAAYRKVIEIIDSYLTSEEEYKDDLLDCAKSTLIFEIIKREKSPADKSTQSLLAHLRCLDINYNKNLMQKVSQVTKEDLHRVCESYLKGLFKDESKRIVVCCNHNKVEDLTKEFEQEGFLLQSLKLEGESFLNSLD